MGHVVVFAPAPVLTVTVEGQHGEPEIHIHAGGQGIWHARMLRALGVEVTMCSVIAGETGRLLRHLIDDEGIELLAVDGSAHNGAYIHDRRDGERVSIAEAGGDRITRHDLDELYGLTLKAGMDAGTVMLSGAVREDIVPATIYRRLASDLNTVGCQVIADLSGKRLTMALAGGLSVVKTAHDELEADGRAAGTDVPELVRAMQQLTSEGASHAIVTRADEPTLLLSDGELSEVQMPTLEVVDTHGGGDSLTAGVAAAMAAGADFQEAVTLGAAAGALNVTRHGLGSGTRETVHRLRELVSIRPLDSVGDE
ncbi:MULTISPECIES: PfkB family carbohydrate kinase [unclassified Brachybacterium]|uniref:PfkB family carbohydrate kinase n=1 Tax=unclassified Brachybacterium TaxID=2623841 RepID=UPI003605FF84